MITSTETYMIKLTYLIITACQRSFGKAMFSYLSVCPSVCLRGSYVTITYDAFDLTVQLLLDMGHHCQPTAPTHGTPLYRDACPLDIEPNCTVPPDIEPHCTSQGTPLYRAPPQDMGPHCTGP